MSIFMDYIKSGEVLLAPRLDYKYQFMLKCTECEECFLLLEPFIDHCTGHYKREAKVEDTAMKEEFGKDEEHKDDEFVYEETILSIDAVTNPEEACSLASSGKDYESDNGDFDASNVLFDKFMEEGDNSENNDDAQWESEKSDNDEPPKAVNDNIANLIQNFMSSSENIAALLDAYENQPQLWNNELYKLTNKEELTKCLQQVVDELTNEINLNVTIKEVKGIIAHLRLLYRTKLERDKAHVKYHEALKNAWLFKRLRFLKSFINSHTIVLLDTHPFDLTHEEILQILEIYKRYPSLWNSEILESCCKNKRAEALTRMAKDIKLEMDVDVDERALKKYLQFLHTSYSKQKRRCLGILLTKEPIFEYYEQLEYLYDHVGPFKCTDCISVFMSPLKLQAHQFQHTGSPGLHCPECNKGFRAVDPYIAHVRRHMNDLGVECKECGRGFLRKADLRIHMRSHTGARPFCCDICGFAFRHSQAFNVHKRRHVKEYSHVCPVCSRGCYTKHELNNHMRMHQDIRDFACNICGKAFKTKKTMQQHTFIHEEGRNHICPICNKGYKNKLGLGHHLKTHSKIKRAIN